MGETLCWFRGVTPDGALTAIVLAVQLYLIWLSYRVSRQTEERSQRHDKLSISPALEFYWYIDTNRLELALRNVGVGPAKVLEQIFIIDGTERRPGDRPSTTDALRAVLGTIGLPAVMLKHLGEFAPNTWIGAGEKSDSIKMELPGFNHDQLFALRDRIQIKMRYQSIYGDDWKTFDADSGFVMRPQAQQ
jgi:hypothetical protein